MKPQTLGHAMALRSVIGRRVFGQFPVPDDASKRDVKLYRHLIQEAGCNDVSLKAPLNRAEARRAFKLNAPRGLKKALQAMRREHLEGREGV